MDRRTFLEGSLATGMASITGVASASRSPPTSMRPISYRLEIQVGRGLVSPLFSRTAGSPLIDDIRGFRRRLAAFGLAMPLVRVRDMPGIPPEGFVVLVDGEVVAQGTVPKRSLHMPFGHMSIMRVFAARVREYSARFPAVENPLPPSTVASRTYEDTSPADRTVTN